MLRGQCHCGAVSYEMPSDEIRCAICHCTDCRRHSGAPFVAWGLVAEDQVKIEGETSEYASSTDGRRHFCPKCGTALFYTNAVVFPAQIDVQLATLDDPDAMRPQLQVQMAERVRWTDSLSEVPSFDRYPG